MAAEHHLRILFEVGALGALPDGSLLGRFLAMQEAVVFEEVVRRHGPMVWGVCRRVLRDHHDAQDAFQATFLVLARRGSSIRAPEKLGHWLYGVAYRTARKARATRASRRRREEPMLATSEPATRADEGRTDLAEIFDGALARLPEKYRIPVVLCDLEGLTQPEAASRLGWPVGTVAGRLARARAMLARQLTQRGVVLPAGSLTLLLAEEAAAASLPAGLLVPTIRAACLTATESASTAGMVSAGATKLSGQVGKTMTTKMISLAIVGLILIAGIARAVPRGGDPTSAPPVRPNDPPPHPALKVDGEPIAFRQVEVSSSELVSHAGLDIYKFDLNMPKGRKFRVIWRELQAPPGQITKDLTTFQFRKVDDGPLNLLASFFPQNNEFRGVLLSPDKLARFRVTCPNAAPTGIVTFASLPLSSAEIAQKFLQVHQVNDNKAKSSAKSTTLITLTANQADKEAGHRCELVVELAD